MNLEFLARVPLFAALEQAELAKLHAYAATARVAAGDYVFRRGDRGDALYIIESGLMEAVIDEETATERTLGTFFPGDYFGEMALLTAEPRSASMRASVDSKLIRITYEQFQHLLENNPTIALHLSKVLSSYLARTNAQLSGQSARISTFIPVGDQTRAKKVAVRLMDSLERQFGKPAIAVTVGNGEDMPSGEPFLHIGGSEFAGMDDPAVVSVINGLRTKYGYILVWASPEEARKRHALLTRFDQTYLAACQPYDAGELVKLHDALNRMSSGGSRVVIVGGRAAGALPVASYSQIRITDADFDAGIDRLARSLAGRTVGLALGSGTAQGLAHLGVMKALIEADIPIDLIAGTSGGALYGSMLASGLTIDESVKRVVYHTRKNLIDKLDFTFPKRGVIRGSRIEKMVQSVIGDITFADLKIPLYAVAADLDTGEEIVIQEGLVYQGVRASISVPGIFEPYSLDGRILVDGVVVNPLPVSVARSEGANLVIGVQVPAPGKVNMEASTRAAGGKNRNDYNIIASIVRSHHFVGDRLARESAADADVFIKPDVTRFGWREYRAAPAIIEEGYKAGQAAVGQIANRLGRNGNP